MPAVPADFHSELPAVPSLELLRKRAKELLRTARAGDPAAIARCRVVPALHELSVTAVAAAVRLSDAQHAIAREHGAASWPALKRRVEDALPLSAQVERYLAAVRDQDRDGARRLATRHPEIARATFMTACCTGALDIVEPALAADPGLAVATDATGEWTPLLYLCGAPAPAEDPQAVAARERIAELLMDAGADPNGSTRWEGDGRDDRLGALYYACVANHPGIVRQLLERGANPNDSESVYHSAQYDHEDCLQLLLAHGAELSRADPRWNNTPLYFITGAEEGSDASAAMVRGTRWLLEHGADPNVPCYHVRETPLHLVARNNRGAALAELFLAHGADPNRPRADGRTPYALAVRTGNRGVAEAMRAHGADVSVITPVDELLGALMAGDEATARRLLAEHPDAIATIAAHDLFVQAARDGRLDAVRLMAQLKFDLGREGSDGGTPLHRAAWFGNPGMVRLLLELGAPIDARDRQFGSSPLAWAAHGSTHCRRADDDYCAVIEQLLDAGAAREPSFNRWNEPPENLARRRVAALLRARGFVPPPG